MKILTFRKGGDAMADDGLIDLTCLTLTTHRISKSLKGQNPDVCQEI